MNFKLALLTLLLSLPTLAQEKVEEDEEASSNQAPVLLQQSRPIEEITVIGERSFNSLRINLEIVEESLYSTYNDLNIDDDFDIHCRKSNYTHTRIQEQRCMPEFLEIAIAENAQDYRRGLDILLTENDLRAHNQAKFQQLETEMLRLAQGHEALMGMLLEFARLEQEFKIRQAECQNQQPVLFLFRKC